MRILRPIFCGEARTWKAASFALLGSAALAFALPSCVNHPHQPPQQGPSSGNDCTSLKNEIANLQSEIQKETTYYNSLPQNDPRRPSVKQTIDSLTGELKFDQSQVKYACAPPPPPAQTIDVLTQHNDNGRTGWYSERTLNASNVRNIKKLFAREVDGQIYAQPLYVSKLGGTVRNVVFVATENDSVYAFDADDPAASSPIWHASLGTPETYFSGCGYRVLSPKVGITSTPVIDPRIG